MGGIVWGNEFRVRSKKRKKKECRMGGGGVTFCTPSFSFPLPLFFFFLLSWAGWDACIRLSIRSYVSACLIQVDVSAEWCSFVSKTFPHIRLLLSSSLSPSFISHSRVCWQSPVPQGEKQILTIMANTHTHLHFHALTVPPHIKSTVAVLMEFWPKF